ncbi:MAG: hypothetical protein CL582_08070 [Alteromonadaceae bacterium]|nr:hypothetical protein [Alteromonadaceae bacterium]
MPDVLVHCRTTPFGDPGSSLVDGVIVSLHPSGGGDALATGTTGSGSNPSGSVLLGGFGANTYEIHVTPPLGAAVVTNGNLHSIEVDAVGASQVFDVLIDVSALPNATDANFCRCSGTFMDAHGKPVDQLSIHFSEASVPVLSYYSGTNTTNAIIPKPQVVRTDSSGHAVIDLIRGATYQVYMEGFGNLSREIEVPDLAAAPLPDVIFPVVDGVEYTTGGSLLTPLDLPTLALSVGGQAVLSLETVHRSGIRAEGLVEVSLTSDDTAEAIAGLAYTGTNTLTISAIGAGTATITVARVEPEEGKGVSIFPQPVLRGTLSVTVT